MHKLARLHSQIMLQLVVFVVGVKSPRSRTFFFRNFVPISSVKRWISRSSSEPEREARGRKSRGPAEGQRGQSQAHRPPPSPLVRLPDSQSLTIPDCGRRCRWRSAALNASERFSITVSGSRVAGGGVLMSMFFFFSSLKSGCRWSRGSEGAE